MSEPIDMVIDGSALRLEALDKALGQPLRVSVADDVWGAVERGEEVVRNIVASGNAAYGVNTGFGHLCRQQIPRDQLETLQTNLVVSHAVGVGPAAPDTVVRWMLLFKAVALCKGVSGISRPTLECLLQLLNADILPVVPTQGSLGASGDLAPLAHLVLPLIGQGRVRLGGEVALASDALPQHGIETVRLRPKEGLALINGTQFMSAYGAVIVVRARRLMKHADIIGGMSLEALMGSTKPFEARLNDLRPHPGALETAQNIRRLLEQSEIQRAHADCDRVQDPYSLRCMPQVHGASRDALRHVEETIEREINSVTDNPIVFPDGDVISGGLFHGEPLALGLDYLAMALAELASISERRVYLLLDGVAGLPVLLMRDTGLNSGFMLPQYTAAALVSENKGLCHPSCVDSIPTSLGQEDHVSMGARSAVKCMQVLENAETVLAIEQMCAAQGLDFRAPLKPGRGVMAAERVVRQVIQFADSDHAYGEDIEHSVELLRSNRVVQSVEAAEGALC